MNKEIWKDIPGYEGLYQASNLGRIKSLIKRVGNKEKILSLTKSGNGYLNLSLSKDKKKTVFTVHVLMAITYLNHKPNGYRLVVDHIDNNKLNNNITNLQLISHRENLSKEGRGVSKYVGVDRYKGKWRARIYHSGRNHHLGHYDTEEQASQAYQQALKKHKKQSR